MSSENTQPRKKSQRRIIMQQIWDFIGFTSEPPYQHIPQHAVIRIKTLVPVAKYDAIQFTGKKSCPYFSNEALGELLSLLLSNKKSVPEAKPEAPRAKATAKLSSRLQIIKALHEIQGDLLGAAELGSVEAKLWALLEKF